MQSPDFTPWSPGLSQNDLAAALAAAGILNAGPPRWYPYPDEVDKLVQDLRNILPDGDGTVRWHEPTQLTKAFQRHTLPNSLAEAWKLAARQGSQYSWPHIHLEAELENPAYLEWYARILNALEDIRTFYVRIQPGSAYLDWRWPLRIGFLPNEQGSAYQERFQSWLDANKWAQGILRLVDSQADEVTVDILFLPDSRLVLSDLKTAPIPVMANCLFAFGRSPAALGALTEQLSSSQGLTQAKGFVFARSKLADFERWLDPFFRELSHNEPFDVALRVASNQVTNNPANAVLFGSQSFIQAARPAAQAKRLIGELRSTPSYGLQLNARMSSHLDLTPGFYSAEIIGDQLEKVMDRFTYYYESAEATTISTLALTVEQVLSQATVQEPEPARIERFLQHQLVDEKDRRDSLSPRQIDRSGGQLIAGHTYRLSVRIGPQEAEWRSVETPFPEEELPKTDRGHLLTVVLTEPNHLSEPQVGTIFLPAAGAASKSWDFHFGVSPEYDLFEGRVLVLHKNRVLQSALLRSPVHKPGGQVPEGRIEFMTEGVVRPLASGLTGRTRYDTAFVFNHASDGKWTGTRVNGLQAVTINLDGVRDTTEHIMRLFNASAWEGKSFDRFDSKETVKLLCELALHGSLLHQILVEDMQVPERLLNSDRIQVVMAREDYHLPVELCYQREAPKSTAKMCPHAAEQLRKGDIGVKCLETCTTKDQESDNVCPLAFWGLNRVIEWHQFDPKTPKALGQGDYTLENEPTQRKGQLKPLNQILLGASDRIKANEVGQFGQFIQQELKIQPVQVLSWDEWKKQIKDDQPGTLVLMVHTQVKQQTPSMEINGKFLDPPIIYKSQVVAPGAEPPLVLLLGCGTRLADVPSHSLAAQFRRSGAAIVVSTLADLLNSHAPRLAQAILAEVAKPSNGQRSFGEVLLAVKRQGLLNGLPIALALLAYGDADWWV